MTDDQTPTPRHDQPRHKRDISSRELQGRLAGLSLPRQVFVLAIWPWLEQLMSFMVGTVDLSLAGHLDPQPLQIAATDALGVTSYVTWLMVMCYTAVGTGAAALIARAIGGRHRRLANAALGQSLLLAVAIGGVVAVSVYALAPVISRLAGLGDDSLTLSVQYLRLVTLAAPFSAVLMVSAAALRSAGDTRSPFVVMLVVNVVNITASYLLVFGPAPFGGHGVSGIAAGTVIAWMTGALMILTVLARGWGGIRLYRHRLRPHAHTLYRIIRVGAPSLLESVGGMWLANFLVLMIVGRLATEGVIGAHMIAIRIESVSFLSGFALSIAAATLAGQYLGLGDPVRARQAIHLCWAVGSVIMVTLGFAFFFVPEFFVRLITDAPVLVEMSVTPIRICGPIQIFFATQMVLAGALRGAGDTRATMWMTTLSTYLLRLPAVYLLGIVWELGLNGVWLALCGELVLRGIIFAVRFWRGRWAGVEV